MLLVLYVDDLLIAGANVELVEYVKKVLKQRFSMKDLGEAKFCLGLQIVRSRSEKLLWLTQEHYMKRVVEKFGMEDARGSAIPLSPGTDMTRIQESEPADD